MQVEIRTDPDLKGLPVVMLSALNEVDRVASCIEAGADDYLSKPFNSVLLRARIAACLEKRAHAVRAVVLAPGESLDL